MKIVKIFHKRKLYKEQRDKLKSKMAFAIKQQPSKLRAFEKENMEV